MALALFHSGFTMWLRVRNPEPHGSTRNEPGAAWLNPEQNPTMDSAPPVPVGGNPEGAAGPGLGLRSGRAIAQPHGAPALDAAAFEALSDAVRNAPFSSVDFFRTAVTRARQDGRWLCVMCGHLPASFSRCIAHVGPPDTANGRIQARKVGCDLSTKWAMCQAVSLRFT